MKTQKLLQFLNHDQFSISRAIMDQNMVLDLTQCDKFPTIIETEIKQFQFLLNFIHELNNYNEADFDPYISITLLDDSQVDSAYWETTFEYNVRENTITINQDTSPDWDENIVPYEIKISDIASISLRYDT